MIPMPVNKQPIAQDDLDETANQLLNIVKQDMGGAEVEQVAQAIELARETCRGVINHARTINDAPTEVHEPGRQLPPLEHALAVATILAQMHIDAVGVAAGVVFEAVDAGCLSLEEVQNVLGYPVERVVSSMLRLNILERKKHNVGAQFLAPTNSTGNA